MRLIDADALIARLEKIYGTDSIVDKIMLRFLKKLIRKQPTGDAVEVVHGEWIKHKINPEAMRLFHQDGIAKAMGENSIFWTCSECKSWGTPAHKYCQNCGAKMDGEKR